MTNRWQLRRALKLESRLHLLAFVLCALGLVAPAQAQNPTVRTIVYDATDMNGSFQIYVKNLDINNVVVGVPVQVTSNGTATQPSQEPQYSLVASANATANPDYLGRIVYQHGASGVRGLHLIKPDGTGGIKLTPDSGTGAITGGPQKGQSYPCRDARDPSWSPDGLHIVYACLEPLATGIGSSYDLWIHDTNGTPDDPTDDADYPLLVLNGPLALQPAWSPDGSRIAYMTSAPGPTTKGATPKIGYISVPPLLNATINVCLPLLFGCQQVTQTLSGTTVLGSGEILTDDAYNDIEPTWDPSSTYIAFSTTRKAAAHGGYANGSNRTIWAVSLSGSIVSQITGSGTSTANDTHPSWPSWNVMYFQSDRSNGINSWLINPTGSESFGGSVLQVTGAPGDSSGDAESGPELKGIDISDGTGDISPNLKTLAAPPPPPFTFPDVHFIVVDLYGGADFGINPCGSYNVWSKTTTYGLGDQVVYQNSVYQSLIANNLNNVPNVPSGSSWSSLGPPPCPGPNSIDVPNLFAAQQYFPTGAFIELTFVPSSYKPYQINGPQGLGYGTHAVDYAYAAVGSAAWNKLNFVAIAVEYADGVTQDGTENGLRYSPWGSPCDRVQEIANAINEVAAKSTHPINTVVYTNADQWNNRIMAGACQLTPYQFAFFGSHQLWEANDNAPTQPTTKGAMTAFGAWGKSQRIGKQYQNDVSVYYGINSPRKLDLDVFDASILTPPSGSTGTGPNVGGPVVNTTTGTAALTVIFSNATQAGVTTASSSTSGPSPPPGYKPVSPQNYYDVTTSVVYTGPIQVCLNYTGISFGVQTNLALFHYENGGWVNQTVPSDPTNNILCASVLSLSPFAIFEKGTLATPVVSITGGTFPYDGAAHGANATAAGVSGASVSGSFTFTYAPGGSSPPVNVGTYSVTAQFTSTDPNYTNASNTGTITIIPAATPTQTTTPSGSMRFARVSHQATLVADGLVLVSGGQNGGTAIPQSELYNPATGTWFLTGSNIIPRFDHSATLLLDGRVLAAGGVSSIGDCSSNVTSETYDPTTGQWSPTSRLPSPVGTGHNAIRLLDGRVLVSGGGDRCGNVFNTVAIFDPTTNKWSAAQNMTAAREFHSAALLPDGRVLVAGGVATSPFAAAATAEIYDPVAGTWTAVASMGTARETSCNGYAQPYLANLSGGTVLAAGGFSGPNCHAITPQRTVTGLTVNPSPVQLSGAGQAQALTFTAQMSDGSTQPFTGPLQFSSVDSTIAAVDSNGLITGVGTGTTNVTVTAAGVSGIAPVIVPTTVATKFLTSITASPASVILIGGAQSQTISVNGQYSDGSQQALTIGVTFASSNTSVATVDPTGVVTSIGNGIATITVSASGAAAVQVPVLVKSLSSITVSPTSIALTAVGQTKALAVTGLFTDGSQQILTGSLSFISSNPAVARVDLSGNVTAVSNGAATITVSLPNVAAVQVPVSVAPTPALLFANPNASQAGQLGLSVSLTGQFTNWVQGTTTASFGVGITVASLTVNSPTSATAALNIDPAATPGPRTITFTTGAEIETLANGFTILAQTSVLVSVNPSSSQRGQLNFSVSLTGQFTNWVQGTTTASFDAGITVSSLTVSSPTSATAVLTIDPATNTGPRTVVVTTGSEVESLGNGFVLIGGPAEVDAKPFSVLNLAGVTGDKPIALEADAVKFSVLNTSGAGGTGGRPSSEADAAEFSVLNLAGVAGGKPVPLEADAVPFSVLNSGGPGGAGGGSGSRFEVDAWIFSVLNLAGVNGGQPVKMEVDGKPFSVKNP